jgi:ADP-heptose:LPS heptosyltransferase
VRALRDRRWDLAIDLQGLLKSAVLTYLSGARWRIGPHSGKEGSRFFYTHRPFLPPERLGVYAGDRYLEMLQLLNLGSSPLPPACGGAGGGNGPASVPRLPIARGPDNPQSAIRNPQSAIGPASVSYPLRLVLSAEDEAFADDFLAQQGITEEDLLISLCPAAAPTFFTKFWFPARWAAVADGLQAEWEARVLFHGAPHDLPLVESIVQQMTTPPVVATGQTTLLQAAALLRRSRLCVSVETGLQHFAVAVGTPVVVLLGPTVNTPPPPHVAVIKPYPCQPCARNPICRFQDGVGECLAAITVEDVLAACRRVVRG